MADVLKFQHYEVACDADGSPCKLGAGAMGVTYKAFDTNLRVPVALKVINATYLQNDSARARFLREARAAAQLRHPNVAAIYHLGHSDDEAYFYSMELIEGETFDTLVRREGPLEPRFALEIALQVTRALVAAHERGLIHRDIKPANLMLSRQHGESTVKVIDFGLAKAVGLNESEEEGAGGFGSLTRTETGGGFIGTPQFASPEQLEGLPLDTRSDIYSLGVTLWYLLAGRPPFEGSSLARIVTQQLSKPPPFEQLPAVPPPLRALLGRMLEKEPSQRPQNPVALRDEMLACLRQTPESAHVPHPGGPLAGDDAPAMPTVAMSDAVKPALVGNGLDATSTATILAEEDSAATMLETPRASFVPGATVAGRFRLVQPLEEGAFKAEDSSTGQFVTLRLLPGDLPAPERRSIAAVAARLGGTAHPLLLRLVDFAPGSAATGPGYFALEWVEGDTVHSLLTRRGKLNLTEALAILEPAADAVDALAALGLASADARPAHVLLPAPESHSGGVKLGPVEFFPAPQNWSGEATFLDAAATAQTPSDGRRALARLAYELLGGSPRQLDAGRYVPLPALNEAGNVVLRQGCLENVGVGGNGDATAGEFIAALRASATGANAAPARTPAADSTLRATTVPNAAPTVPATDPASTQLPPAPVPVPAPPAVPKHRVWPLAAAALFLLLAGAAGLAVWWNQGHRQPPAARGAETSAAVAPAKAAPAARPAVPVPFRADAPWENSLGMKFLPASGLLAGIWPARVGDFAAFIQATDYDAVGGMYSLGADGRRRPVGRTWKEPGFVQDATHPVVGVNFDDANAFCAWLTRREREAGLLPANLAYRLPTDAEWTRLATGQEESAASQVELPETRAARAPEIFPWGKAWPPPPGSGNYAGAESGLGATLPGYDDGAPRTSPVGKFPPNPQGLYDLSGNVWQWCADRFRSGVQWRTVRGGSWLSATRAELRLGARVGYDPAFRQDDVGFRCVLAPGS